ncbi:hypothetical protein [Bacillus sp. 1P06AnD]|uniref:hypothetical protein n=1 Tax=Bacillus sp. 1P06AnD TaxID=3132208 RepID=UPI00399F55BF
MAFVIPVTQYEYVQYGNRTAYIEERKKQMQHVKGLQPVFRIVLDHAGEKNEEEDLHEEAYTSSKLSRPSEKAGYQLNSKPVKAPRITGKGMLLDEMI